MFFICNCKASFLVAFKLVIYAFEFALELVAIPPSRLNVNCDLFQTIWFMEQYFILRKKKNLNEIWYEKRFSAQLIWAKAKKKLNLNSWISIFVNNTCILCRYMFSSIVIVCLVNNFRSQRQQQTYTIKYRFSFSIHFRDNASPLYWLKSAVNEW